MSTTRRGEVAFPQGGEGAYFAFTLTEGEGLEEAFGEDFFEKIELAARNGVIKPILHCIRIGLKRRDATGKAVRVVDDIDGLSFHWTEACNPVLDAVSYLVANCGYDDLLAKVAEARQKQFDGALVELKEAAERTGAPLSEEALATALSRSLFGQG